MKKKSFYIIPMMMVLASWCWSCSEGIVIDNVDEGAYGQVNALVGTLRDASTGKISDVIDLHSKDQTRKVAFQLTKAPKKGVDVQVEVDESYLDQYNQEHGTDFKLYPEHKISIQNDGKILVAPDEKKSFELEVEIPALDPDRYPADKTYLLPLKATVTTEGVQVSEEQSHLVYLVRNLANQAEIVRKPGEKKVFCFLEVNDTHPLNVLQWETEDGRLLTDYVVFFAYNINYNKDLGEVHVFPNPQCQFILDHADQMIEPLRARGIKVLLGLLGNHDAAGLAQLSPLGCKHFAKKLAAICDAYHFDGVNFDDEYSDEPDLTNPLMCKPSTGAGTRLCMETKRAMPDKLVTVFQYNGMMLLDTCDGIETGEFVDIAVANYGGAALPRKGMTLANCSAMSVEFARGGYIGLDDAQGWAKSDYGYVMIFAPWASGKQGSPRHMEYLSNLAEGLYGSRLKKPEYYYPDIQSFETTAY